MAPKKMTIANPKQDDDIKVDSSEIDAVPKVIKKTVSIIKKKQPTSGKSVEIEKNEEESKPNVVKPKIVKKVLLQEPLKKNDIDAKDAKDAKDTKDAKDEVDAKDDTKDDTKEDADDREILLDTSKMSKTKKHTNKKQDSNAVSNDLFNEEDVDFRTVLLNYDFSKNKTPAKITKYEKALLIGKRGKQIEEGANPNVKVLPGQSAIEIAEEELRQRKIPLIIKRPLGNTFEYWRPRDMEVLMD